MRFSLSMLFVAFLALSAIAQESSKYLKVERVDISGKAFQMLKTPANNTEVGGDSLPIDRVSRFRDSTTSRHIPPTESQLEDRQFRNYNLERIADNHYISINFSNLTDKEVKWISFQLHVSEKGKSVYKGNFKLKPRSPSGRRLFARESFFSVDNLSKPDSKKEIIIKRIEFADGTKLKF